MAENSVSLSHRISNSCEDGAFFSVIIPMYNVEAYIEECLKSVLLQSFRSVELIVVDDGSCDKSADNCLALMEEGFDFILIGQRQSGPNVARNLGLELSSGKYILFMDADDRFSDLALEKLHSNISSYPTVDVTSFGYTFFDDSSGKVRAGFLPSRMTLENEDIFVESLIGRQFGGVCWNKCYDRIFILETQARFIPDRVHGRDLIFSRTIALKAKTWQSIDICIYQSRYRSGSFSRNFSMRNISSALDVAQKHLDVFEDLAKKRGQLAALNFAIYRHLRYIILLSAFRSSSYSEYRSYLKTVKESSLWNPFYGEFEVGSSHIMRRVISQLVVMPRSCWIASQILKKLGYEPY